MATCAKHSECPTCCVLVASIEANHCSPNNFCDDLCIDTCGFGGIYDGSWAGDGWCDDGGFGSDYDACELGTDCADCGPR